MPFFTPRTLQKCCLHAISRNFSGYVQFYNSRTHEQNIFYDYLEFLQRCYSDELLHILGTMRPLSNEYVPFLMNRYLRKLTLYPSLKCDISLVIQRLQIMGDKIRHVQLSDYKNLLSDEVLMQILLHVPNVEMLGLSETNSNDRVLERIGLCCPLVRELHLSSCDITGAGLRTLIRRHDNGDSIANIKLTKLHIYEAAVEEDDLIFLLRNCPNLKILDHELLFSSVYKDYKQSFPSGSLDAVSKYQLKMLDDINFKLLDVSDVVGIAAMCPSIAVQTFHNVCESSLLACCKFEQLKYVKLFFSGAQDCTPLLIARRCTLVDFVLRNGSISVEALRNCFKLKGLVLHNTRLTNSAALSLSPTVVAFPSLLHLSFNSFDLSDASTLKAIRFILVNSPNLLCLVFYNCYGLNESMFCLLMKCLCLKNLQLLEIRSINFDIRTAHKLFASVPGSEAVDFSVSVLQF